jgi:hypothetical protein
MPCDSNTRLALSTCVPTHRKWLNSTVLSNGPSLALHLHRKKTLQGVIETFGSTAISYGASSLGKL